MRAAQWFTDLNSSRRQHGSAIAFHRLFIPSSPTSFRARDRDLSWEPPLVSRRPNSVNTTCVNSHRVKLEEKQTLQQVNSGDPCVPRAGSIVFTDVYNLPLSEDQCYQMKLSVPEFFQWAAGFSESFAELQRSFRSQLIHREIQLYQGAVVWSQGLGQTLTAPPCQLSGTESEKRWDSSNHNAN